MNKKNIARAFVIVGLLALSFQPNELKAQNRVPPAWFIPANQLQADVSAEIIFKASTKEFEYHYAIKNSAQSKQSLMSWGIRKLFSETQMTAPQGWSTSIHSLDILSIWLYLEDDLLPGSTAEGFILKSPLLPGFVDYYYQSDFSSTLMPDRPAEPTEEDYRAFAELTNFPINYVKGTTIGPAVELTGGFQGAWLYLNDQFNLMVGKGWIYNKGIENSLRKKIEHIQKSIAKGKDKTVDNQIKSLINEVSALNDKHIHPDARALILSLSEYLLTF